MKKLILRRWFEGIYRRQQDVNNLMFGLFLFGVAENLGLPTTIGTA